MPIEAIDLQPDLRYQEIPVKILDTVTRRTRNSEVQICRVQWSRHGVEEATWECEDSLKKEFPHLFRSQPNLEDEIQFKWGRFVTSRKNLLIKSLANLFSKFFIVELKTQFPNFRCPDIRFPLSFHLFPPPVPSLFFLAAVPSHAARPPVGHARPLAAVGADASLPFSLFPSLLFFLFFFSLFPIFFSPFFFFSPLSPSFLLCRARLARPPSPLLRHARPAAPGPALTRTPPLPAARTRAPAPYPRALTPGRLHAPTHAPRARGARHAEPQRRNARRDITAPDPARRATRAHAAARSTAITAGHPGPARLAPNVHPPRRSPLAPCPAADPTCGTPLLAPPQSRRLAARAKPSARSFPSTCHSERP